jgi:Flp pilus assembly protein TadG
MIEPLHATRKFMQLCVRFTAREDGSILATFALALIPIAAMIGAAVDYSRANNLRTQLQGALDSALLAGARDGSTNWTSVATNFFNGNVQPRNSTVATPSFALTPDRAYTGSVTATVSTDFLGLMGIKSINVGVTATARVGSPSGGYYCVLALNQTAQAALQLTGNATITITAPKCVVQVNSNSSSAVTLNGNTSINSVENCFVGGVWSVGNSSISPGPDKSCKAIPDPFAAYPRPTVGPCDYVDYSLAGNKTATLLPGVYCGGMKFNGPVNVTFSPGLYVIKDGVISETGGSFSGQGVSFFLTGFGASMQLSGQADWHIVAATGAPLPGFAIFLDPNGPTGPAANTSALSGQSELYFEGVVYLPQQQVSVSGTAAAVAPSPYISFIADTLRFVGNGELVINNDTSKTAVPIPTALLVQTNGGIALSQ